MLSSSASPFTKVGLFVDWNTQIRLAPEAFENSPVERARFALRSVGRSIAKLLCSLNSTAVFRVRIRLYHGWTMGVTQTVNRKAVTQLAEFDDPDSIFPSRRVLAQTDIEFGDRLIDALPSREINGLRIHLPGTCRRQSKNEPLTEKMVDTALASDLLSWARIEPNSIAIVVSSDDDLIPPTFVAEAWMKPLGGLVQLLRPTGSKFLSLEGLVP